MADTAARVAGLVLVEAAATTTAIAARVIPAATIGAAALAAVTSNVADLTTLDIELARLHYRTT